MNNRRPYESSNRSRQRSRSPRRSRHSRSRSPIRHSSSKKDSGARRKHDSSLTDTPSSHVVCIRGLPATTGLCTLQVSILERVGPYVFVQLLEKPGSSSIKALIEFDKFDLVRKCIKKMDGTLFGDQRISVFEIEDLENFMLENSIGQSSSSRRGVAPDQCSSSPPETREYEKLEHHHHQYYSYNNISVPRVRSYLGYEECDRFTSDHRPQHETDGAGAMEEEPARAAPAAQAAAARAAPAPGHPPLPRNLVTVPTSLPSLLPGAVNPRYLSAGYGIGGWRGHADDRYVLRFGWRQPIPMLTLPPGMEWVIEPWTGLGDAQGPEKKKLELLYGIYCYWVHSARIYVGRSRRSPYRGHLALWQYRFAELVLGLNLAIDAFSLFYEVPPRILISFYLSLILQFTYLWAIAALPRNRFEGRKPHPEAWHLPSSKDERQATIQLGATGPSILLYPHAQEEKADLIFNEKAVMKSIEERFGARRPPVVVNSYFGTFHPSEEHYYEAYTDWPTHFTPPLQFRTPEVVEASQQMDHRWKVEWPYEGILSDAASAAYEACDLPKPPGMDSRRAAQDEGRRLRDLLIDYFDHCH